MSRSLSSRPARRIGLFQITCTAVLWGTGGVVVRLLHAHASLSPVSIAFYRLAVAAPVLLLLLARELPAVPAALRAAPGPLVAIGVGLGAYQALYFVAVTTAGVSVATVVSIGLAPVLITGWEAGTTGRRPGSRTVATVGAALGGLVLVALAGGQATSTSPHPLLGLLCATGSGLGYAGATVLSQRAAPAVPPLPLATVTTVVGALVLAPVAAFSGLAFPLAPAPVLALAYLGPITTALAFWLFYLGLHTTPTSTAAVLTLLEPLAAATLAVAVLGDPLPLTTVLGGLLMLGAVAALYVSAPGRRQPTGG
jgi:DME family drug/metabolite transporter